MTNHVILNNIDHKDLTINTEKSEELGNAVNKSIVFPFEFKQLQRHYPIFFQKNASNAQTVAVALMGFESGENLFLTSTGWSVDYIPLAIERDPFLIGYQDVQENGQTIKQTVIHLDMDSPRVNVQNGTNVFLPQGGNSEYLNRISSILKTIDEGQSSTTAFMDMLAEFDLLEPVNVDIQLNDGSNNRLSGYYTINEEKLYALSGDTLETLNKGGFLMLIYMVIASHANLTDLIKRKNDKELAK